MNDIPVSSKWESISACSLPLTVYQLNTGCPTGREACGAQPSYWQQILLNQCFTTPSVPSHERSWYFYHKAVRKEQIDEISFPTLLGASILEEPEGSCSARETEQLKLFPHFGKLKSHRVFPAQLSLKQSFSRLREHPSPPCPVLTLLLRINSAHSCTPSKGEVTSSRQKKALRAEGRR